MAEYSAEGGERGSATVQRARRSRWRALRVARRGQVPDHRWHLRARRRSRRSRGRWLSQSAPTCAALWRINDAVSAELRTTYSRGRVDFDGFPAPTFALTDTREYGDHRRARRLRRRQRHDVRRQAAEPHRLRVHGHGPREHRSGLAGADDVRRDGPQRALGIPGHADAHRQRRRRLRPGVRALELNTRSPCEFDPNPCRSRTTRASTASTRNCRSRRSRR